MKRYDVTIQDTISYYAVITLHCLIAVTCVTKSEKSEK